MRGKYGPWLRLRRQEQQLSQEVLARFAELDRSYLARIERGEVMPGRDIRDRINKALNIDPQDMGYLRSLPQHERAVQIRLDGLKDREWLVAETAKIDAELADIDAQLASIPDAINPALIRELSVAAIQHRDHINALSAQQSADLLGPLGVVQFGPSGVTIKYNEPYSFLFPKPAILNWPGHKAK